MVGQQTSPADTFSQGSAMQDTCIYTALMGDYERLADPLPNLESGLKLICFTDDKDLTSEHWEVRYVEPAFPMDPVRSQRVVKICPHRFLPDFARSMYIDSGIIFKVPPEQLLAQYGQCDLALASHSFRCTLLDEFIEVSRLGLDDQSRVFEQLNHYELSDPDLLDEKPLWGAILVRNHMRPPVQDFSETWLSHVLRYSRRDQLSLNWALKHSQIEPTIIDIDNHGSWFHDWSPGERKRQDWLRDPRAGFMPLRARRRESELFPPASSAATPSPAAQAQPHASSLTVGGASDKYAKLGQIDFLGLDPKGRSTAYARDHAVATEVASRHEAGERWFSIVDDGEMKSALVLSRPNVDLETSVFLRWKQHGRDQIGRILLEPDGKGYARLKIDLDP